MKFWKRYVICALACMCCSCGSDSAPGTEGTPDGDVGGDTPGGNTVVQPDTTCEAHEELCGGVCTDVMSSVSHCGGCTTVCRENEHCANGQCVGCRGTMCGDACVDLMSDALNCGECGNYCQANMACSNGQCGCERDWTDCDGDATNGCETRGECSCVRGQKLPCYEGPDATRGVGACREGMKTCEADESGYLVFGECEGMVLPNYVLTCTEEDLNCNGIPDGQEDNDLDGYTICDGDCCDSRSMCNMNNPELIHPGMMEVADNDIDDNCNGVIDEPLATSNDVPALEFSYGTTGGEDAARAMAQAMGIIWMCAPESSCNYGLVDARLTRASSLQPPDMRQINILPSLRNAAGVAKVLPREGKTFAVMSSGSALDVYSGVPLSDLEMETIVSETTVGGEVQRVSQYSRIPDVYATVHDHKLATHEKCPVGTVVPAIFDSVQLHLELKVPSNAKGIQFDFRFFSREYPQYICSKFNDFFLALLTTGHPDLSEYPDHNIAFDKNGNPVSINNGFFTTCRRIPCKADSDCPAFMGCVEKMCSAGADTCQDGDSAIEAYSPTPYGYGNGFGGGTAWLSTTAPVIGGEIISLDFYIWDTQDRKYDSTVLLDNFRWLLDETKVNTGFATDVN